MRRRLAHQHRDGMLVLAALPIQVDRLGPRALDLGAGHGDVGLADDAHAVAVLRQLQRFLVGGHGRVQQALLLIEHAQLQIGLHQRGLRAQAGRRQVGQAGRRAGLGGLDIAAHAAPHVQLPTDAARQRILVGHVAAARRRGRRTAAAAAAARAGQAGARAHGGEEPGARAAHQAQRLAVIGLGLGDGLVRRVERVHQAIERGVVIDAPPLAAVGVIARFGALPAGHFVLPFLVGRAHVQRRPLVVRADGAGGQRGAQRQRDAGARQKDGRERLGVADHSCSIEAAPPRRARPRAAQRRKRSR
ncbi:Uncharacterised protein [Achromobacter sp. 2789STDY5608633]|nr:Uncharacterised protein [Achromobacter sp. 2789STDY5608633]